MICLPYKADFIFRRKNTAILLVQNNKKHCIAWFLTNVFTDLNLKHRGTYKLSFKSSGKQDFLGSEIFGIFQWESQQILPVIFNFQPLFRRLVFQIISHWLNVKKKTSLVIFRINCFYRFVSI